MGFTIGFVVVLLSFTGGHARAEDLQVVGHNTIQNTRQPADASLPNRLSITNADGSRGTYPVITPNDTQNRQWGPGETYIYTTGDGTYKVMQTDQSGKGIEVARFPWRARGQGF